MARRKSGQGTVRLRKDGRWEGRVVIGYDENGLPKTKNVTAKTKTECIEKLENLKDETGFICREKVHSRMTFGEWIDFWYQNYCKIRIKESTQEGYETRIYNHIIPKIGKIPLNELTQNDLQKFYNSLKQDGRLRYRDTLGEGLSDRFVRSCHANCRTALQKATDDRLIKKNPAIGCKIPPKKSREMQVLTPDEIKRFLIQAKCDGFFEIFLVALSTGLRRGEDMALKWEDLNLDTGELKVRRQVKRTKGRLVITEPKTEESVRTIILPKSLVSILKEYKETIDSEWMFPSPKVEGMPRDPSAVYGMMQVILERAECKKLRFHDLRHTFATTSVANGMDIKTLSTILGHVSSKTTLDIYLHSTEEMKKEAAEKINARFNKDTNGNEKTITDKQKKPSQAKFEPKKGKMRKPGTGCISKINDHLYEGRYSPKDAYGKRMARNIYAPTREECEEKLAILIKEMKAEIAEQKAKLRMAQ